MKESTKKWLGFFSWVPLSIFTASVIYFMYVSRPLLEHQLYHQHEKVVYYLNEYYSSMFWWLCIGSVIGITILLIYAVHLLKLKTMHPGTKALWFIFMAFTGSFALPIFYYLELKNEPEDVPLHPNIEYRTPGY